MNFEWDPVKARRNRRKHRVSFQEATTVLSDPLGVTYPDPDHSEYEQRFITLGMSAASRVLVVVHLEDADRIRMISARKANQSEREDYEENQR